MAEIVKNERLDILLLSMVLPPFKQNGYTSFIASALVSAN
jgi:hypothetical protein